MTNSRAAVKDDGWIVYESYVSLSHGVKCDVKRYLIYVLYVGFR